MGGDGSGECGPQVVGLVQRRVGQDRGQHLRDDLRRHGLTLRPAAQSAPGLDAIGEDVDVDGPRRGVRAVGDEERVRPREVDPAREIKDGKQAFIIYPLIEESDKIEARAAVDDYETLSKEVFPDLKLGLLHGRMRPQEKDDAMLKFRDKKYNILVSTTVIEVGVDVPNATVMLIEGADRFGLAQLHQLRGRVGRGSDQSFCLLIPTHEDAAENERLRAMAESNDGFVLAEKDLQQRGPGEFLGTRQSGYSSGLRMASITDVKLIEKARVQAQKLFEQDPYLNQPEHALLAEAFGRFWGDGKGDVS